MSERKKQWKNLHDLKPDRPMIIFEPYWLDGYLSDYTLRCEDEALRNLEIKMMFTIRQFEQMGDDIVVEPYFRLGWQGVNINSTGTDFGEIKIVEHHAKEASLAYLSNFPIQTPEDIKRLTPRSFQVEKEPVIGMKNILDDCFGDILPVKIGNFDNFDPCLGNQPFIGNFFIGVTWDLFKLIGSQAMMLWPYDYPDELKLLLDFLVDDKKRFFEYLEDEKLICFNTDNQFAGPSCYGYVSDLPAPDSEKDVRLCDLWTWSESQESEAISPQMFNEFYLPYMADLANMFGLSYYGCCERIDQKFEHIVKAIHNIRIFSVSGWSNFEAAAELIGKDYVYSRKPVPAYVSSFEPDWDAVKKEARQTWNAAKNCSLEVILRDVYSSLCTPQRSVEWVKIWKETIGI
jgi:hypothetical protein